MPDTYDARTRSEVMRRVKGRDTEPEVMLRRALFSLGVRGWRCHRPDVPGKPDLCFNRGRLAVFIDGAFWHGHPSKYWRGRSGEYWDHKIGRNIERDREANEKLSSAGWNVLRIWDFEVQSNPLCAAERVMDALERSRNGERVVDVPATTLAQGPPETRKQMHIIDSPIKP
jgi:DNA mismatch endonuclease (patch repair protein)